jgi:nitrous oxidase accessory protein
MYSERNVVEDNDYSENMVGIFLMYSDGVVIRRNTITQGIGATSMGIGFKESSDVLLEDNTILRCATGIYLDISPYEPDTTNRFFRNRIAFNSIGVMFHSDWHGNVFEGNDFDDNFTQVAVRAEGARRDKPGVGIAGLAIGGSIEMEMAQGTARTKFIPMQIASGSISRMRPSFAARRCSR